MLNKIFIMGRLTRDPELRRTQTGTPVASFSLAVDRDFKDKSTGERATDVIDVVACADLIDSRAQYMVDKYGIKKMSVEETHRQACPARSCSLQARSGTRTVVMKRR